mgnify:CR=1 FL=1
MTEELFRADAYLTSCEATVTAVDAAGTDWIFARFGGPDEGHPAADAGNVKHAVLKALNWKLDRLGPALPRAMPGAEIDGELNADATIALTQKPNELDIDWSGTDTTPRSAMNTSSSVTSSARAPVVGAPTASSRCWMTPAPSRPSRRRLGRSVKTT